MNNCFVRDVVAAARDVHTNLDRNESMNSRERVLTALDHREPDKVPLDCKVTGLRDEARHIYETTDYCLVADIPGLGPFEGACFTRGHDQFCMDLHLYVPFAEALLDKITGSSMKCLLRRSKSDDNLFQWASTDRQCQRRVTRQVARIGLTDTRVDDNVSMSAIEDSSVVL